MKINWSQILIVAMGLFIIFIVSLGIRMATSSSELYESDYYAKGEKHAERMEKEEVAQQLDIQYDLQNRRLEFAGEGQIGLKHVRSIYLSDSKADFLVRIDSTSQDHFSLPLTLKSGDWVLEITGTLNNEGFFKKLEVRP